MYGIIICLYTGLRIGELPALRREDIDFRRNLLYINRTGHDGRDGDGNYVLICNSPESRRPADFAVAVPLPKSSSILFAVERKSGFG